MAQPPDTPGRLRHHSFSAEQLAALARGGGDEDAIGQLVAAQRSKHLILLGKVAELARRGDHPDDALGVAGWQLLAHVQERDPAAAAEVMAYPSVGAWALHVIRSGSVPAADAAPADAAAPASAPLPGVRPSGLAAIAAAAAIRAGLDAEIEVPVLGAGVLLPSLGAAEAAGVTAVVAAKEAEVRSGDLRVRARPGEPGWRELRRATAGRLSLLVDDLDPFRMPTPDGGPTGRLTPSQLTELRDTLRAAWPVLSPASAAQIAGMVRVIVPYRAPESGDFSISVSSPQVFGTVAMSRQPDKYLCAETLVHETQHLKLCALLDLVTLTLPDDGQRYYAPWRPDPRPVSGLLQGAYAFLGVSGFWREQRQSAPEPEVRHRAHADFARWRDGAASVAATLLRSGRLTRVGETFVATMAEVLDEWRREPVPGDALAVARRKSDLHLARWQANNGRADTG
ncbi:MAG TPA: HEXXH motif domain-containing protein [Trebonia sp.]|nr:HEXXH motif domain-containing protein [Trebonia sp.]